MIFIRGVVPLGDGKVISCRYNDGYTEFITATEGALLKRKIKQGARFVGAGKIISYAEEAYFCGNGIIERKGESFNYVS